VDLPDLLADLPDFQDLGQRRRRANTGFLAKDILQVGKKINDLKF